ncbi:hypothetical protein UY3_02980 [Chelonia mydas]|uniref:Uncharacterized protein n=1 Tax=Chelonia mydas TaxID=8469 RepID=M7C5N5_CHEMY|nr:hypothetical protein UY3_02980 [Chelonia mydas]
MDQCPIVLGAVQTQNGKMALAPKLSTFRAALLVIRALKIDFLTPPLTSGLALKSALPGRIWGSVDTIRRYWPPGAIPECSIVTALDSTLNSDALARDGEKQHDRNCPLSENEEFSAVLENTRHIFVLCDMHLEQDVRLLSEPGASQPCSEVNNTANRTLEVKGLVKLLDTTGYETYTAATLKPVIMQGTEFSRME